MNAVDVRGLHFSYDGKNEILRGLTFSVSQGEIFVIAGLSGCGKTTLCHILSGIIPHSVGGHIEGEVLIDGEKISSVTENAAHVGLVFQDSDAQTVTTTVEDELAFGPENMCMDPGEIREKLTETAKWLGLSHKLPDDPASLSGGQKKLLCIGSVLMLSPDIIILDEPFCSLDSEGRETVRSIIFELKRSGRTVIIVEHDLSLVDFADRWMLLKDGVISALGAPRDISRETLKASEMWFD